MTHEEIVVLAELVRRWSGVVIDTEKAYLVESRLGPVTRREGFATIHDLIMTIAQKREERLIWAVVEAMASSETAFFRDRVPFDQLRDEVIPALAARRPSGALRVWSAGCATGEEPYSLAILVEEERDRFPGLRVDIFASDLSERSLEKAQAGLYTHFEVQRGMPSRLLIKHFDKVGDAWTLSPRIRQAVRWRRANLLGDLRSLGQFDCILCRNVLSAFDEPTRRQVLEQLALALPDDGFLVLGLNETVMGATEAFRPVPGRRGLYRRSAAREAVA